MSVQRSPPPQDTATHLKTPSTVLHYNSDPSLNTNTGDLSEVRDNYFNITKRQKRTFGDIEHSTSSTNEIRELFEAFTIRQENKFDSLYTAINTVLTQNEDIKSTLQNLSSQHNELLQKVHKLELENSTYKERICSMEKQIDIMEKDLHRSTVEIRNISKQENEDKSQLYSIIQNIGSELGLGLIRDEELKDIHRTRSGAIIVDFSTARRKENIISEFKKYNKTKKDDKKSLLNSEHINLPGPPSRIYLSEYLSTKTKRIYYEARQLIKNKKLFATWPYYGNIYVKVNQDSTPMRISEEQQLQELSK